MSTRKYFGTDGIRNTVGQGLISPDQVLKLGWATGSVMKKRGLKSVLIGKDTRISGYMFESALESGFIAAGIDVYLVGPMPTPAISYLTQTFNHDLGVVISASHNPHEDNGIKFFSAEGTKISDEMELAIEAEFEKKIAVVGSDEFGKAMRIDDAAGRYVEYCKATYRARTKLRGMRIALDCANGATYHVAPDVFTEMGAEVFTMANEPNGMNINKGCGATDLAALKEFVIKHRADIGIAFDGDGDRVMMIDEDGDEVDGDIILYILATMIGRQPEGVVGTVMSNMGIEIALKEKGIAFERSNVGDRYVMQKLIEKDWFYGAEPSGHVLCLNKSATGDGIVAALQVLAALTLNSKKLHEIKKEFTLFPSELINVTVSDNKTVNENDVLQDAVENAENTLAGKGRVLIRPSGTEPKIRVMVEGEDAVLVKELANKLAEVVKSEFS